MNRRHSAVTLGNQSPYSNHGSGLLGANDSCSTVKPRSRPRILVNYPFSYPIPRPPSSTLLIPKFSECITQSTSVRCTVVILHSFVLLDLGLILVESKLGYRYPEVIWMSSMSEKSASKPQKRRPHRKTRTGCLPCKRRKIESNTWWLVTWKWDC